MSRLFLHIYIMRIFIPVYLECQSTSANIICLQAKCASFCAIFNFQHYSSKITSSEQCVPRKCYSPPPLFSLYPRSMQDAAFFEVNNPFYRPMGASPTCSSVGWMGYFANSSPLLAAKLTCIFSSVCVCMPSMCC